MTEAETGAARNATATIAAELAGLQYDSLPSEVVEVLKAILLDSLGTSLAASTLGAGCRELVAVARAAGGAPESTIIGFGDKVPAVMAALVNGGLVHALNYDAVGAAHLGLIPLAPLAVAERAGGVSGREFLAALAAGCELAARLGAAIGSGHPTALLGQVLSYMGTAAAAGRILGLSPGEMHSALGLALMQTAGMRQVVIEGDPPAKAIYGSFPSQGGVLSALLAREGLGAECDAIEGDAGLFVLVSRDGEERPSLDTRFDGKNYLLNATFKPWPVSGHVTPYIEAALEIARKHNISTHEIARITLQGVPEIRAWFEPAEKRKRPENSPAAANSIYFGVAKALTNGGVTLGDFTPEGLQQPEALALADRMDHVLVEGIGHGGVVEVTAASGAIFTSRIETPLGSPSRPMGWQRLTEKFRDCARYAANPISDAALDRAIDLVKHLEDVADVSVLPALLSGGRPAR